MTDPTNTQQDEVAEVPAPPEPSYGPEYGKQSGEKIEHYADHLAKQGIEIVVEGSTDEGPVADDINDSGPAVMGA